MTRSSPLRRMAVLLGGSLCITGAAAQPSPPASPHTAPPAQLPFDSTLARYQRFEDPPLRPWRESNDTVGRIGGWKAYAREASAPAQAAPAAADGADEGNVGRHGHQHHAPQAPRQEPRP